jgi:hypothetical protein
MEKKIPAQNPEELFQKSFDDKLKEQDFSNFTDQQLIDRYRSLQQLTHHSIESRNRYEHQANSSTDNSDLWESSVEDRQRSIEKNLTQLGYLREEIDKRKIKLPTMEELDKTGDYYGPEREAENNKRKQAEVDAKEDQKRAGG